MLKVTKEVIKQIKKIALNALPNEGCGYLAGNNNTITHCYELTNTDHSPEHFSFDPREQFETLKDAQQKGLDIIANFHSHPETPARPSEEDIRLAFDPDIYYGIISLADNDHPLNFYQIKASQVTQVNYIKT